MGLVEAHRVCAGVLGRTPGKGLFEERLQLHTA